MKHTKIMTFITTAPVIMFAGMAITNAASFQLAPKTTEPSIINIGDCDDGPRRLVGRDTLIDQCGNPGGGGDTGPTIAPTTPASINYFGFTNDNSIRVSWAPSDGYGHPVVYELYEKVGTGSWRQLPSTARNSVIRSGLANGRIQYKVRAKIPRSTLLSRFRTGDISIINTIEEPNLYADYPVLHDMDHSIKKYRLNNASIKTVLPRKRLVGQSRVYNFNDEDLILGDGIDLISNQTITTCLDVHDPEFEVRKTPAISGETFKVTYVQTNSELAEELDVSQSAQKPSRTF